MGQTHGTTSKKGVQQFDLCRPFDEKQEYLGGVPPAENTPFPTSLLSRSIDIAKKLERPDISRLGSEAKKAFDLLCDGNFRCEWGSACEEVESGVDVDGFLQYVYNDDASCHQDYQGNLLSVGLFRWTSKDQREVQRRLMSNPSSPRLWESLTKTEQEYLTNRVQHHFFRQHASKLSADAFTSVARELYRMLGPLGEKGLPDAVDVSNVVVDVLGSQPEEPPFEMVGLNFNSVIIKAIEAFSANENCAIAANLAECLSRLEVLQPRADHCRVAALRAGHLYTCLENDAEAWKKAEDCFVCAWYHDVRNDGQKHPFGGLVDLIVDALLMMLYPRLPELVPEDIQAYAMISALTAILYQAGFLRTCKEEDLKKFVRSVGKRGSQRLNPIYKNERAATTVLLLAVRSPSSANFRARLLSTAAPGKPF